MTEDLTELVDDLKLFIADGRKSHKAHDEAIRALQARMNKFALVSEAAPSDVRTLMPSLTEYKAQSIGSDASGGYLVLDQPGPYFDRMRPASVVMQANPVSVDLSGERMQLPSLSSSTTVYTPGEAGTITDSSLALRTVAIVARKYAVRTIASNELLSDSNPSAREIIARDHQSQLAARLDLDMLQSTGTGNTITGLRRTPGVTTTALGSGNGGTITLNDIEAGLYRLEADNADLSRVAIFMHPRTWSTLRREQDQQDRYQLQPDPTSEAIRRLFGAPVFVSSQITIAETVGASVDCSYVVLADMSKVAVGRRQEVGVLYDPYSRSSTDEVVVQTITRWGFAVLDVNAVEIITGVRA